MKQINHCIAHCLALACGQAADSDHYLKRYLIYYSGKHSLNLTKVQAVLNYGKSLKMQLPCK